MGRRKLDLVGQRFGRLTVVNFDKKINKKYFWNCICDCGEKIIRPGQSLISGQTQSCGCLQKERAHETHFKDLMGRKFSRIKVISFKGIYNKRTYWNCICDCGKEKVINGDHLKRGLILSCGCLRNERIRETQLKDLTGKIFGRITVINFDRRKNGNIFWNCICKCGKKISINGNSLKRGLTVSCGCYKLHRIIDEIYDGKSYYTKEEWKEIIKEETSNGKFFR